MKTFLIIFLIYILITLGCNKKSTDPEPVSESHLSITGDVTESYQVTALFGTSTYTADTIEKEYFTLLLFPNVEGSNPLAFTMLYKSGTGLPATESYHIDEYALGEDKPANHFGGGFSGINTEGFGGYKLNQGTINFKSVSESVNSGELDVSGYWAQGVAEDTTRTVILSGKIHAIPMPEN